MPRLFLAMQNDIAHFALRDDDIWIVTFPKCGTTWLQETLTMLVNDLDLVINWRSENLANLIANFKMWIVYELPHFFLHFYKIFQNFARNILHF